MNRDDIIRMAQEAGFEMDDSCVLEPSIVWYIVEGQLERFAALVAVHTLANNPPSSFTSYQEGFEAGRFAEREACAKVCDKFNFGQAPKMIQDAIRARGQA
jgi:hypothetical protein